MSACHCLCLIHHNFASVHCRGEQETMARIAGMVVEDREVPMCNPCARWWEESQVYPSRPQSIREANLPEFDSDAFYLAIITERRLRGVGSMREVCRQAGIPGASTMSRIKQGGRPDVDSLAKLMHWLGRTDLAPFLRYKGDR